MMWRRAVNRKIPAMAVIVGALTAHTAGAQSVHYYDVPDGARPHDFAPAPDGTVWYTAQRQAALGRLDPSTGAVVQIPLGDGSAPHGVIVGPDGAAWVTDGGQNAIVRVDSASQRVDVYPLPPGQGNANLNTAALDGNGVLWFTGQNGIYGRFDPATEAMTVWEAPRGRGPYGIAATPNGGIYFASLAGSYVARVDTQTGAVDVFEPPTPGKGARRVWSDSQGRMWISEWNAGQVSVFDPRDASWRSWSLPGSSPRAYSVFVDDNDDVWLSDFSANAIVRCDPDTVQFESFPSTLPDANVRQMLGRPGEVWGAESGTDRLVVIDLDADG